MTKGEKIIEIAKKEPFQDSFGVLHMIFNSIWWDSEYKEKTGHWIYTGFEDKITCSLCHKIVWDIVKSPVHRFDYCPSCGAKMKQISGD